MNYNINLSKKSKRLLKEYATFNDITLKQALLSVVQTAHSDGYKSKRDTTTLHCLLNDVEYKCLVNQLSQIGYRQKRTRVLNNVINEYLGGGNDEMC